MTPERKRKKGGTHLERKGDAGKKEKKPRTRDEIIRRRVTILACVAAALLLLAVALRLWIREPSLPNPGLPDGEVVEPGGNVANNSDRKEGVYTFLLLGRDTGGGGNTDTMMMATYDTKNQTVDVLNIYRDTMVNAPWDIKRINSVYNAADGGEEGIESLKTYLRQLLGFAPDYYVTIEWDAVGQLVDAIGGVDFYVPYEMHYYDPTQNLRINQAKGQRTLDGDDAMQVIRWRKNNDGSHTSVGDIGRVEIQQDFLQAVVEQCLTTINISTIPKFAQIFMEQVTTDIPLGTIVWFGQRAMGLSSENLRFHSLPGNLNGSAWSRSYKSYQSYVLPDGPAIVELVNTYLSPYKEGVELTDLDIMSVNRDGSLSSSKGTVRDSAAAKAPSIPSKTPAEPDDEVDVGGTGESEPPQPSPTPSAAPTQEVPPEFQTPNPTDSNRPGVTPSPPVTVSPSGAPTLPPRPTAEGSVPPSVTSPPTPTPTPTALPTATPATGNEVSPEFLPGTPQPVG